MHHRCSALTLLLIVVVLCGCGESRPATRESASRPESRIVRAPAPSAAIPFTTQPAPPPSIAPAPTLNPKSPVRSPGATPSPANNPRFTAVLSNPRVRYGVGPRINFAVDYRIKGEAKPVNCALIIRSAQGNAYHVDFYTLVLGMEGTLEASGEAPAGSDPGPFELHLEIIENYKTLHRASDSVKASAKHTTAASAKIVKEVLAELWKNQPAPHAQAWEPAGSQRLQSPGSLISAVFGRIDDKAGWQLKEKFGMQKLIHLMIFNLPQGEAPDLLDKIKQCTDDPALAMCFVNNANVVVGPVSDPAAFREKLLDFATIQSVGSADRSISLHLKPPKPAPPKRAKITDPQLIPTALRDLDSAAPARSFKACERLAGSEPNNRRRDVVKAIEKLLKQMPKTWDAGDRDQIRQAAAKALCTWGGPESVPTFVDLLGKLHDDDLGKMIVDAVDAFQDEQTTELVAMRLADDDSRRWIKVILAARGSKAEKAVLKVLKHRDANTRLAALEVLETLGTEASIPALDEVLREVTADNLYAHRAKGAARSAVNAIYNAQRVAPAVAPMSPSN